GTIPVIAFATLSISGSNSDNGSTSSLRANKRLHQRTSAAHAESRPYLHQLPPAIEERRPRVSCNHLVALGVGERSLDDLRREVGLLPRPGRERSTEAMHRSVVIPDATQAL